MDNLKTLIMNASFLSTEDKLGLIRKIFNHEMDEHSQKELAKLLKENEKKIEDAENTYIKNMTKIYIQFLNKNISQLQQGITKLKLSVSEELNEEKGENVEDILHHIEE